MKRQYIDCGLNERKARALYSLLLSDSRRNAELFSVTIEETTWWSVYYSTIKEV